MYEEIEKIKLEILKLIEEYNCNNVHQANCLIISSEYYHILFDYVEKSIGECIKFTKLYDLELIVIHSKNFIKVSRREII